jgi:hypothetical protein
MSQSSEKNQRAPSTNVLIRSEGFAPDGEAAGLRE